MTPPLFSLRIERTVSIEEVEPEPRQRDLAGELRSLVVELDREAAGAPDPDRVARRMWRGLLDGGWMLLDSFERDDRWYLVARERPAGEPRPSLTEREQEVLALAARGHANKFIAYELGLTSSTVATHLRRGMTKLGLSTRAELLSASPVAEMTMDRRLGDPRQK